MLHQQKQKISWRWNQSNDTLLKSESTLERHILLPKETTYQVLVDEYVYNKYTKKHKERQKTKIYLKRPLEKEWLPKNRGWQPIDKKTSSQNSIIQKKFQKHPFKTSRIEQHLIDAYFSFQPCHFVTECKHMNFDE